GGFHITVHHMAQQAGRRSLSMCAGNRDRSEFTHEFSQELMISDDCEVAVQRLLNLNMIIFKCVSCNISIALFDIALIKRQDIYPFVSQLVFCKNFLINVRAPNCMTQVMQYLSKGAHACTLYTNKMKFFHRDTKLSQYIKVVAHV